MARTLELLTDIATKIVSSPLTSQKYTKKITAPL